jgi:hypothetical protein
MFFFFSNLPKKFCCIVAAFIPRMHPAEGHFYPQRQGNTLLFSRKQFILHFCCWLSEREKGLIHKARAHATITTWSGAAATADTTSQVQILDSSSIQGIAVMRDTVFLTGGVTTSGTRVQNCTFFQRHRHGRPRKHPPHRTHMVLISRTSPHHATLPRADTAAEAARCTEFCCKFIN